MKYGPRWIKASFLSTHWKLKRFDFHWSFLPTHHLLKLILPSKKPKPKQPTTKKPLKILIALYTDKQVLTHFSVFKTRQSRKTLAWQEVYKGHLLDRFQRFKMYFICGDTPPSKLIYTYQTLPNTVQITSLCCGQVLQTIPFNM